MSDVEQVPIDQIVVGDRMRKVDPDKVRAFAASMEKVGLLQPILVTTDRQLAAGAHRLAAARELGWETIAAQVRDFDGPEWLRLAEIDENLHRSDLTTLEWAEHLAERERILVSLGIRATPGRVAQDGEAPPVTADDLAVEYGCSKRTIEYRLQIGRGLTRDARETLKASRKVSDSLLDLLAIAKLEAKEQRRVADLVVNGGQRVNVALDLVAGIKRDGAPPPAAQDGSELPPADYDDREAAERLYPVQFEAHLRFAGHNPRVRTRGSDVKERETIDLDHPFVFTFSGSHLGSQDGLWALLESAAERIYGDEALTKAWLSAPRPNAGADERDDEHDAGPGAPDAAGEVAVDGDEPPELDDDAPWPGE